SGGIKGKYLYNGIQIGNDIDEAHNWQGDAFHNIRDYSGQIQGLDHWRVKTASVGLDVNGNKCVLNVELEAILSQYNISYNVDQEKGRNSDNNPRTYITGEESENIQDAIPNAYFSFDGWYDNPDFTGNRITRIGEDAYGDKTLYAKFTGNSYNITYELNGGSNPGTNLTSYNYGDGVESFADAVPPEGYNFVGWFEDSDFKTPITKIATDRHGDVTLYAKYESEQPGPEPTPEDEYTITYRFYGFDGDSKKVLDGVKNNNPSKYKKGESVSLSDPSKSGYKFDAWYIDNTFSTKTTGISAGAAGNKKFYAKFIKDKSGGDDDDDDDDAQPFKPNPDALIAFYYLKNGTLDPKAKIGKEVQGAAANAAFKMAVPAGWKEAFTFSMSNEDKHTYTLKDGTIKLYVPEGFQKAGRMYAILAMGQKGAVKLLSDTDTLASWITVNPNVEGYAFELIYMD
nr:InlB B-repeat-containing protein [Lachnospiraceae bacterium]